MSEYFAILDQLSYTYPIQTRHASHLSGPRRVIFMEKNYFNKVAFSTVQQIELLKHRGLEITNYSNTKQCLDTVSFHRLGAYFLPHEICKQSHKFKAGTTFNHIWNLYVFESELRLLVLDVI